LDLLAARAATNGNPAFAELVARLRAGSIANNAQDLQDLLAQISQNNPNAHLIAKYLAEQQSSGRSPAQPVEADAEPQGQIAHSSRGPGGGHENIESSSDAMSELRLQVESMFGELQSLRARVDLLAWALGACSLCWGEDPDCRICRGR